MLVKHGFMPQCVRHADKCFLLLSHKWYSCFSVLISFMIAVEQISQLLKHSGPNGNACFL
jgi:hypothetical protein